MIAFELSALLPGLCVPRPQNWDLTVVSIKSCSRSQFAPTSNGQSTYAKYSSGFCWGIINDERHHP